MSRPRTNEQAAAFVTLFELLSTEDKNAVIAAIMKMLTRVATAEVPSERTRKPRVNGPQKGEPIATTQ